MILIDALLAPNPGAFVNQLLPFLLLKVSNQLLKLILSLGEVLLQIARVRFYFSISGGQSVDLCLQFNGHFLFFLYLHLHSTYFSLLFDNGVVFVFLLFLEVANDVLVILMLGDFLLDLLVLLFVEFGQMVATLF